MSRPWCCGRSMSRRAGAKLSCCGLPKFAPALKELEAYYEMPGDAAFICDYRLRNEVGIDVRELEGCLIDFVPNVK